MKIIDSCYEDVVAKLTTLGKIKDISDQLLSLTTNDERVLFVYKILQDLNVFPSVQEVNKNDDISIHYRNQGNQCFIQAEYHKALQFYNLSLLNAIVHSENYCLALSNRSAVFYELKKYNECMQDIDKIFTMKYPEKIFEKLAKRQEMCKEAILQHNNVSEVSSNLNEMLTMQADKDSRYLSSSIKLKVVFTEEMGRHVIAKEDINVGEVLVEEDPYFTLLLKSQYLFCCNYCLSRNLHLLPCDYCCLCLYCSKECKERARTEYHSIECPLMANLVDMDFTKLELLALRTVIRARHDHEDWESLYKTIEEAELNFNTEFRGHVKVNDKWIYDSKYYTSIHSLATNIEKRSISDIFQKAVTAAVFLKFLEVKTEFLKTDCEKKYQKIRSTVARLLLLHLMTSPTNMHGISSNTENEEGNFTEQISLASAPYAFLSLLNHSCAPNVVRFSKLGSSNMKLFAIRPIKKGMQIFDNYGVHHALQDLMSRQASLKFQYKFVCFCEACINNWPNYFLLQMRPCRKVPEKLKRSKSRSLTTEKIRKLEKGDISTAIEVYKSVCSLCERLEPYAPCVELCDCQESLKQCLAIIKGLVPYGNIQLIEWKAVPLITTESNTLKKLLINPCKKLTL